MYIKWDMTGIVIGEISEKGDVSLKFCIQHYDGNFQAGIFRTHPTAILDGSESAGAVKVNWWGSSNWSSSQIFLEELTGHYYISIRLYIHRYIYIYLDTYIYIYTYGCRLGAKCQARPTALGHFLTPNISNMHIISTVYESSGLVSSRNLASGERARRAQGRCTQLRDHWGWNSR